MAVSEENLSILSNDDIEYHVDLDDCLSIRKTFILDDKIAIGIQKIAEGTVIDGDILPTIITFFDSKLKVAQTLNVNAAFKADNVNISPENIDISSDGLMLSCCINGKLQIYNLNTKDISTIIDLSSNTSSGLCGMYNLKFVNKNKSIAFYGEEAITDRTQVSVFGMIDLDGDNLKYFENKDIDSFIQSSDKYAFFDETNFPYGEKSNGKVYGISYETKSQMTFELIDKNESQKAFISKNGDMIVTVEEYNSNGKPLYKYRVYNSETMRLLNEFDAYFEDKDFTTSSVFDLSISSDNNNFIVLYLQNGKTYLYKYEVN